MAETIIRAGTLVDVRGGELLHDQAILITDGRVDEVRPWNAAPLDAAQVIDLSDHVVTPGLIDLHTHLIGHLDRGSYVPYLTGSAGRDVLDGVKNASTTLRAGFTTVRDVGTFRAFLDCDLRDAIEAGICEGPRMVCSGAYVTCSSGGGEITDLALDIELPEDFRFGVANSVDQIRDAVRRIAHRGANVIKIITTGAVYATGTVPGAPEYTEEEIRAAVDEAANYGIYVAAHAHGAKGALRAIRAGVRTIEHGTLLDDECFAAMIEHGTYFVPTTYLLSWIEQSGEVESYPSGVREKTASVAPAAREALRKAIEAGVRIAYGTDAIVFPHGKNAGQLMDFVEAGMSPIGAIRSATLDAAECLGRDDVGAIEPGRFADIIAVRGATIEPIDRFMSVDFVMKGGTVVVQPAA